MPTQPALGEIFWGANFLAGFSALAAASIAKRVGLLNTMIFTHAPSNLLLILVPFMPTLPLAAGVLLLRFAISQMDVPARQSYTAAVVRPDERSAAAGVTGVARTAGAALSPFIVGFCSPTPRWPARPSWFPASSSWYMTACYTGDSGRPLLRKSALNRFL